ncbi:diguanylate cyclase domain-containing protein [Quadrisphaera sp. KR29]|uniref:diguanylate cyclase domain-containing protein n=1 Tax=Quadrisphaera sp. KR29 TaxID=3461391 RepID=UPI00404509E9
MRRVGAFAVAPAGVLLAVGALVVLQLQGAARGWPWPLQLVLWVAFFASRDDGVQRVLGGGSLERRAVLRTALGCLLGVLGACSAGVPEAAPVLCTLVTAVHLQWSARWSLPAGLAWICLSVPVGALGDHLGQAPWLTGAQGLWLSVALMGLGVATAGNLALLAAQQDEAHRRLAAAQQLREDLLRRAADQYALTGLLSRSAVTALLERVAADAAPGSAAGVLFCDLDGFKAVNDGHGHAAGDALLVQVAARLTAAVGDAGAVGRVGGDEFVVVLPRLARAEHAHEAAQRVRDALDTPVPVAGALLRVGTSVGVAVASAPAGADALLDAADAAMYADKARRRRERGPAGLPGGPVPTAAAPAAPRA